MLEQGLLLQIGAGLEVRRLDSGWGLGRRERTVEGGWGRREWVMEGGWCKDGGRWGWGYGGGLPRKGTGGWG